jgi:hypothetical protein
MPRNQAALREPPRIERLAVLAGAESPVGLVLIKEVKPSLPLRCWKRLASAKVGVAEGVLGLGTFGISGPIAASHR